MELEIIRDSADVHNYVGHGGGCGSIAGKISPRSMSGMAGDLRILVLSGVPLHLGIAGHPRAIDSNLLPEMGYARLDG